MEIENEEMQKPASVLALVNAGCPAETPIPLPPPQSLPPSQSLPPLNRKSSIDEKIHTLHGLHHTYLSFLAKVLMAHVNHRSLTRTEAVQDGQNPLEEVVGCIERQLKSLPIVSRYHCIYRVPKPLRKTNKGAYTPVMVSIGPFHYKTKRLLPMEDYKLKYLQAFLSASSRADVKTYIQFVKDNETKIRNCYGNTTNQIPSNDFIKMALLDSVFIIELFKRFHNPELRKGDLYIYGPSRKYIQIKKDITLAENQLPFFLLMEIYKIANGTANNDGIPCFTVLACKFFDVQGTKLNIDANTNEAECCHLLDFLRYHYLPKNCIEADKPSDVEEEEDEKVSICKMLLHQRLSKSYVGHIIEMRDKNGEERKEREETKKHQDIVVPSATTLHQSGVRFKRAECQGPDMLDIEFEPTKGILRIPKLRVDNWTEVWFRNVLAFEQCYCLDNAYFTYYQRFMDFLINTPGDVKLLVDAGIIENLLGSDEDVCYLFNTFVKDAIFDHESYYYGRISWMLNSHCQKKWNRHKAILKQKYFGHPWAVISVIYAVVLLILTIAQVIGGIIPFTSLGTQRGN